MANFIGVLLALCFWFLPIANQNQFQSGSQLTSWQEHGKQLAYARVYGRMAEGIVYHSWKPSRYKIVLPPHQWDSLLGWLNKLDPQISTVPLVYNQPAGIYLYQPKSNIALTVYTYNLPSSHIHRIENSYWFCWQGSRYEIVVQ